MLDLFSRHLSIMSTLVQRLSIVLSGQSAEIASLQKQLAEALANDAADDAAISAAEAAAQAAADRAQDAEATVKRLQDLVDLDKVEDQAINDLLAPFESAVQSPESSQAD